MILAAGRGKRLMPLTSHTPKPLIKFDGIPILAHHFENLQKAGFLNVYVNISYLGHLILQEFGYNYKGLRIFYSFEPYPPLETAGGITFAKPWGLSEYPFLVINADIICDWPITKAFKIGSQEINGKKLAYLILTNNPLEKGDFCLKKNYVTDTPALPYEHSKKLTFTGIGIYSPKLFQNIKRGSFCALKKVLVPAIEAGLVKGECHRGLWEDIGSEQRLKRALQICKKERG